MGDQPGAGFARCLVAANLGAVRLRRVELELAGPAARADRLQVLDRAGPHVADDLEAVLGKGHAGDVDVNDMAGVIDGHVGRGSASRAGDGEVARAEGGGRIDLVQVAQHREGERHRDAADERDAWIRPKVRTVGVGRVNDERVRVVVERGRRRDPVRARHEIPPLHRSLVRRIGDVVQIVDAAFEVARRLHVRAGRARAVSVAARQGVGHGNRAHREGHRVVAGNARVPVDDDVLSS